LRSISRITCILRRKTTIKTIIEEDFTLKRETMTTIRDD